MEGVGALFDDRAASYDRAYESRGANGHILRARLAVTLAFLGDGPGEVLDAGMGPGRLCHELDRRGWMVAGVDASGAMVSLARRRLPHARERLVEGTIDAIPFPDESFDAVAATGVLEYVPDVRGALQELCRVLRPGGRLVVSMPNPLAPYAVWRGHVWYPLADRLRRRSRTARPRGIRRRSFLPLVASAGMTVEGEQHVNFMLVPTPLESVFPRASVWLAERLEGRGLRAGNLLATQLVVAARRGG